ncbi:MAG: outer membrane beta-barrel protein [Acidobacteria bacterium]|nr:outer membrane beta-barrel protein [Acidobacteriota bacterium]
MQTSPTVVSLCILAIILVPSPADAAQQPGDRAFTASIGYADSHNESVYETDDALTLSFDYQETRNVSYRGMVGFVTINSSTSSAGATALPDADAFFVLGNLVLNARFNFLNPFLTFGVGVYSVRLSENGNTSNNLELGANWGGGLDIQLLSSFALRGEIIFHYTTGDVSNPIDTITIGGRFTF